MSGRHRDAIRLYNNANRRAISLEALPMGVERQIGDGEREATLVAGVPVMNLARV
jgi:hypothetical protein